MIENKKNKIKQIILITSTTCNLNCKYCYIKKTKDLAKMSKGVEDMITEFKYIDKINEDFDNISETVDTIEFWGAEPTLTLDLITENLQHLFKKLPNLRTMFFSTNFTTPGCVDKISKLISKLDLLKSSMSTSEKFILNIQISCDGPWEINDRNRGLGTTNKIVANFKELLNTNLDLNNIILYIHTKPTWDKETLEYLDSEVRCNQYIDFFINNFYIPYQDRTKNLSNFEFQLASSNLETPQVYTVEDGKRMANILKYWYNIITEPGLTNKEIAVKTCLRPYSNIIGRQQSNRDHDKFISVPLSYCGIGTDSAVMTYTGEYLTCHKNYTDEVVPDEVLGQDTKSKFKTHFTPEEWQDKIEFYKQVRNASTIIECSTLVAHARLAAICGLVDKKYLKLEELEKAVPFLSSMGTCHLDNESLRGDIGLTDYNINYVWLNGAHDWYTRMDEFIKMKGIDINDRSGAR